MRSVQAGKVLFFTLWLPQMQTPEASTRLTSQHLIIIVSSTAACASCVIVSDLECFFGYVCPLHSGPGEPFLVAFCKRSGPYQSVVTQSASCWGAGLVLTMLMTSSLLNWEALCYMYEKQNRPVLPLQTHLLQSPIK